MHSKSRIIPFVLLLLIILAGCAYENTGSINATPEADRAMFASRNSRTVMTGTGEYEAPSYYIIKLISNASSATVKEQEYYPTESSVTFSEVPVGTYKVAAYGYNSKEGQILLGYGEADVTVSAAGTTGTTIIVTPVSEGESLTGTVKIDMSWASNVQIDKIVLVDSSNNEIASQIVENASTATGTTFSQPVSVGLDKKYHFNFYFENKYVGSTGEEVFNIYSGQIATTDNAHLYEGLTFEDAITLRGFAVSPLSELGKMEVSYIVPNDFTSIVFTAKKDGVTTVEKEIKAGDESLPAAGSTATFIIEGLEDGSEYTFSAYIVLSTGKQSEAVTEKATTPVKLTNVVLFYDETEANNMTPNGSTMTLTAEYTPSTAADLGGTWESSAPTVATVVVDPENSKKATVTGVDMGETIITYTAANNNVKATYTLTISLNKPTLKVKATAEGNVLSWQNNGVADTYEVIRNDEVIYTIKEKSTMTYTDNNIVSGKEYKYAVRASLNGANPVTSDTVTVTAISDPDITIEFVTPERLEVAMADLKQNQEFERTETVTLSANIERAVSYQWYLNGKTRADWNTGTVTFNSTDAEVATGYNAARQSVMLTVTTADKLTYSGTLYFYYVDTKATGIEFTESNKKVYTTDTDAYVTANVLPLNSASLTKVKYTSSDSSVVTVDPDTGKVTAFKNGEATITASTLDGSFTSTINIDAAVPVTSLTLNQTAGTLIFAADRDNGYNKETTSLSYTITEGAKYPEVTWTNNAEAVVSITDNEDGSKTVTPLTAGTATITVTSVDNPSISATYNVTVYEVAIFNNGSNATLNTFHLDGTGGLFWNENTTVIELKFRKDSSDEAFSEDYPEGYTTTWSGGPYGFGSDTYNVKIKTSDQTTATIKRQGANTDCNGYFNATLANTNGNSVTVRAYHTN